MRKSDVGLGIVLSCVASWALLSAYHVEPRTAGQSGWTSKVSPNHTVSQVVTMNFDELDSDAGGCYVELFSEDSCTGKGYGLVVSTYRGGTAIA